MAVDQLELLVAFAEELRRAGLAVNVDRVAAAAEALGHWGVADGAEPYWPLRVAFCADRADLLLFETVYRRRFGDPSTGEVPMASAAPPRTVGNGAGAGRTPGETDDGGNASGSAGLAGSDFEDLPEAALRTAAAWVDQLRPVPLRRTMHRRAARRGVVDPARTMRLMLRNGGELVRLRHVRRSWRPQRLLLLVDVSRSMETYSEMLLRFAHAALVANPRTTEVFTVGTRYTHVTRPLRTLRPEVALPAAGQAVTDWSGGTTLGVALRDFLRRWGGSRAVRSALVVLGSDGFDDQPDLMIAQVDRLARLARLLIWVDPSRRDEDYRPLDARVARAQASAGRVVGGHNYEKLRDLAKVITDA